jgi:CrcB protein
MGATDIESRWPRSKAARRLRKGITFSMLWYIAAGSAIGGVGRYLLGGVFQRQTAGTFPVGTLVINVTGSFLLGMILRYAVDTPTLTPEARAFLTIGLCGGYTTFSTFSYETVALLEDGQWPRAAAYVLLSVALSVLATFLGIAAARELIAVRVR